MGETSVRSINNTGSNTNVNYNYGITGYIPVTYTNFTKSAAMQAKTKDNQPLWRVMAAYIDETDNLQNIFPYLSMTMASIMKYDTNGITQIPIFKDTLFYTYYEYENSIFRFYDDKHLYEEYHQSDDDFGDVWTKDGNGGWE